MHRLAFAIVFVLPLAACSKSPTDPSDPGSGILRGQTVSAIDGAASPNLSLRIAERFSVTSDANGNFEVEVGPNGTYRAIIRGNAVVERETRITGPGSAPARVSLIPASFDLRAFDEMFRTSNARLERWTSRPALVVLAAIMDYRNAAESYEATGEQLSDEELNVMVGHLTEGLALLTGGTYTTFASVEIERPAAGTRVTPMRTGKIVVGRYNGIVSFARTIGYGQWMAMQDGSIAGGATFLDRDFDRNDNRRRLLRIHELGHALGYQHVESRTSIMNPSIGPEPNEFDRAGSIIAFQRPVGNRSPDIDPTTTSVAVGTGEGRWSPPTVCR